MSPTYINKRQRRILTQGSREPGKSRLLASERRVLPDNRLPAKADSPLHLRRQFPLVKRATSSGGIGSPYITWIVPRPGNFCVRGQALKAPSMATGNIAAPERTANAVNPGRKRAIWPSRLRVPSGKINTISPRFRRRSDSLMPFSLSPSRSMGIASNERISQPSGAK